MILKFRIFIKRFKKIAQVTLIDFEDNYLTCETEIDDGIYQEFEVSFAELLFGEAYLTHSTGLFDNSNPKKEIFERDVVKRKSLIPGGKDLVGVVKILEGCWVIDNGKEAIYLWTEVDENIVIGNIYENPELLEGPHD